MFALASVPKPPRHRPSGGVDAVPARTDSRRRWIVSALALALVAMVLAAYRGVLDHSFLDWDDWEYVTDNALVLGRRWGHLLRAVVSLNYHPLTMLSLAWNAAAPLSARAFLATNVALHAIDTLLVFALVLRLSGGRRLVAFFVAALFGVHPMHVESVAWISERKDVLYAMFFLGAALAYSHYLERRDARLLAVAFGSFLLSCLSKGVAVAFPLVMVLMDLHARRTLLGRRSILEKLPFFAAALLFGLIALDVQSGGDFHGLLRPTRAEDGALAMRLPYSALERVALPAYGNLLYVGKLFVPLRLCAFDPYPAPGEAKLALLVLALLFLAAMIAAVVLDRTRTRAIALGLGWYLATVVLVLQWIPVGAAIVADRYVYLPYVGLSFLGAVGIQSVYERSRRAGTLLWIGAALFLAFLFVRTPAQVATWRDSEALWSRVIEVHPRAEMAYVRRGVGRLATARLDDATSDFEAALRLGSRSPDLYDGLGNAYGALGKIDSSLAMYDRAVSLAPHRVEFLRNRATIHLRRSRPREALADLDRARTLAPDEAAMLDGPRGVAHRQLGMIREAVADFDRALASRPADPVTLYQRGACKAELGDRAGAVRDFQEALRLDPGLDAARVRLESLGAPERR